MYFSFEHIALMFVIIPRYIVKIIRLKVVPFPRMRGWESRILFLEGSI